MPVTQVDADPFAAAPQPQKVVPVSHNPFAAGAPKTAVPVDHDPFKPSTVSGDNKSKGGIISQIGDAYKSGVAGSWDKLKSDFIASQPDKAKFQKAGFWDRQKQQFDQMVSAGKLPLDAFNAALSVTGIPQVIGAANDAAGKAVSKVLPDIPQNKNIPAINVAKSFSDTLGTAEMMAMPEKGKLAKSAAPKELPPKEPPAAPAPPPPPKGTGSGTPPVALGYVRFYHGGDNPTSGGPRWTTTDPEYAKNFRAMGKPKNVHYVDLPKGHPEEVKARNWDDIDEQYKTNMVGRYNHAELPEDVVAKMRPYNASSVPPPPKGAMPIEGPLSKAPALTKPRSFEDQLFQLESNRVADKLDVMKAVKNAPDVKPETWEKLYHHEENPEGVPLSPEEKAVYDQHIAPLKAESENLTKELEGYGYKLPSEGKGYTPRYVAGRTRSFGEVLAQWIEGKEPRFQGGAAARSMRQTVDNQMSRNFFKAVSPDGEEMVVHIGKDGKVSGFDPDRAPPDFADFKMGQKRAPGAKISVPSEGQTWRLEDATTKEIEDVAATRYHKNVLANRLDNVAKLRSAVRNAKFIQAMKESPDWANVAQKTSETLEPPVTNGRTWRVPKTPQFQGYYMEPTVADALDDFSGRTRDLDGLTNGLDKVGNVVKGSIFWNPIPHMRNVANHYFVEKGLVGTATSLPSTMRSLTRAARAVMTQNEDYMRSLRAGASLPYARLITSDLHKALTAKLGEDVAANPKEWGKIAQIAGYANPVDMVKSIYKVANHALWSFGDVLSVARQMELAEKGVPFAKAIKMTEEHMPNYRVPGQVMGSRMMSQLLTSPVATMFGRYQYNRLASYMNMAKDMVSSETSIKDKAAAMDKLAMLGVMLTMYYPALDKAWQAMTGNKNAKVTRPGAASVPQAAYDVATGTKGPAQGAQSVFSPGIVEAPVEAYHGRYLYSGQPIAYPENLTDGHPDQFVRDLGSWIGSKVSPVGQAQRIVEGGQSAKQFLLSQIGVQSPTDEQVANKQKYGNRDAKYAIRRAVKKANQRGD